MVGRVLGAGAANCLLFLPAGIHHQSLLVLVVQTLIWLSEAPCCRAAAKLVSVKFCSVVYQLCRTEQAVQTSMWWLLATRMGCPTRPWLWSPSCQPSVFSSSSDCNSAWDITITEHIHQIYNGLKLSHVCTKHLWQCLSYSILLTRCSKVTNFLFT